MIFKAVMRLYEFLFLFGRAILIARTPTSIDRFFSLHFKIDDVYVSSGDHDLCDFCDISRLHLGYFISAQCTLVTYRLTFHRSVVVFNLGDLISKMLSSFFLFL